MSGPLRTIVLAGGGGRRLAEITGGVPKQYWRLDGVHTLLEATLERLRPLTTANRTVIVAREDHATLMAGTGAPGLGRVLLQPGDRGTAPAVLFGLAEVLDEAPDDITLVTPSDHGVADSVAFQNSLLEGAAAVARRAADIVLFGATPSYAATDYGWILLGPQSGGRGARLADVRAFVEKPAPCEARALFESGAVWSTLLVVGRAFSLFRLFERHLPHLGTAMGRYLGVRHRARVSCLEDIYADLASSDFSRDVLMPARGLSAMTLSAAVGWTDLGTPDRFAEWQVSAAAATWMRSAPRRARRPR